MNEFWTHRRKVIFASAILTIIGSITAVITYVQVSYISHIVDLRKEDTLSHAQAILILGASINANKTPSDALRDRLDTGIAIYRKGMADKILLTGDDGSFHAAEIAVMKQYVHDRDIPDSDVLVDGKGYRTYESCKNAKNTFHLSNIIIVTQRFHIGRALYLCNKLGVDSVGIASDPTTYQKGVQFWIRDLLASAKAWFDIAIWPPESPVEKPDGLIEEPIEQATTSSQTVTEPPIEAVTSTEATTSTEPTAEIPTQIIPVALATSTSLPIQPTSVSTTQYVLLAFDGSYSIPMWKDTRAFAQTMISQGKPVHFTYFISGVYLLGNAFAKTYIAPHGGGPGKSAIGFGGGKKDIANRIEQINLALSEGHEIGGHANGHFSGSSWSADDWKSELQQFDHIIKNVGTINGLQNEPNQRQRINLPPQGITGFRAPDLGVSAGLYPTLKELGYVYDCSKAAKQDVWPSKDASGIWEVPLAKIKYNAATSTILSMDYNFYFKQSAAKDAFKKGTPEWQQAYDETLNSFQHYFDLNYAGNRAPVQIGNHFSTWNDGVYWEAMKTLAENVCGKPDVKCVTMGEAVNEISQSKH
jgi:vancomycin permeability regulator SanA